MPVFIAHVELQFEAEGVAAGGKRLHQLAQVARAAGFELTRGRVEPAPPPADADTGGWTKYTPDGA